MMVYNYVVFLAALLYYMDSKSGLRFLLVFFLKHQALLEINAWTILLMTPAALYYNYLMDRTASLDMVDRFIMIGLSVVTVLVSPQIAATMYFFHHTS